MRLVIGLGNPGAEYHLTRHNVGFRCIDHIARQWDVGLLERRTKAVLGEGRAWGIPLVLAKPRTYMNNSGEGVAYLLARFHAAPEDLLVVYDEMDLPLGKVRIRRGGSDAGHKGIRSIIAALGTRDFARVRVGISRPPEGIDRIDYLLSPFTAPEVTVIEEAVSTVSEAVAGVLREGIEIAMNRFN